MPKLRYIIFLLFLVHCQGKQIHVEMGVMTYNIRYNNPGDGINAWPNRVQDVVQLIRSYQPDLLGIQEALKGQVMDLESNLPEYGWFGVGRDDGKERGEYSPIFYLKEKFDLINGGTFWLSETPDDTGSVGWDAAITRIVTWTSLKYKPSGSIFYFFNTHFDHRGVLAREASAKLLVSKIREIANSKFVVLTGDFNFQDTSKAYQNLFDTQDILRDAFEILDQKINGQTGTCCGFNVEEPHDRRIDYIFLSEPLTASHYRTITDQKDGRYPSDHLPVYVEVTGR